MESVEVASRVIMWNVEHPAHTVAMYLVFLVSLIVASVGVGARVVLWSAGKDDSDKHPTLRERVISLLVNGFGQRKVVRTKSGAYAHLLVYLGFLVLTFTTTMVMLHHDFNIKIYQGEFYLGVTLMSDLFGFGLLIGCLLFLHRRLVEQPDLLHSRPADVGLLAILILLVVQGFLLEGLRIAATDDPWKWWSPIGALVAAPLWPLSEPALRALHLFTWWFHTLTVFFALAMLPYSKLFHIFASSFNLYLEKRLRPRGALSSPGNLAQLMESDPDAFSVGLGSIKDYSWKQLLDLDACTSCGRCQDACPAYRTGKPLSPKWIILDTRNHLLSLQATELAPQGSGVPGWNFVPKLLKALDRTLLGWFLKSSGVGADGTYVDGGSFRAENKQVQQAALKLGGTSDALIAGDVIDPEAFWSCTTCYACVEACPVGINHVDQIVGNRRHMVLMRGELPHEAQATLRALETRGNPYGPPEQRMQWAAGLSLRVLKPGDKVDYLYWVGCVSAYDQRKQKIARSLVTLFNKAGLSFGVLGNAEGCTGDPARRLGEENLFQTMATANLELLRSIQFHTLVANCPHCFNTIANEYPQFGNLGEGRKPRIVHHSVLLKDLLDSKQLELPQAHGEEQWTFHDPCYLGRYNGEYDAPRDTIKAKKGLTIIETEESRSKSMCCGAGGGHFWMDLKNGDRVNVKRVEQLAATGATKVATGCPFCLHMLEDGMKLTSRDESHTVKDIAEVLSEAFESPPSSSSAH